MRRSGDGGHRSAVAQALLVTFLWSTSWVLIKIGLADEQLSPLGFAGARYMLAALLLLPFALPRLSAAGSWRSRRSPLLRALILGVLLYAVTQGAQFAALAVLPAVTLGLVLTATPAVVAMAGWRDGTDRVSGLQAAGIGLLLAGAGLYFWPISEGLPIGTGLLIAGVALLANAASAILARSLARDSLAPLGGAIGLTAIGMLVGGGLLLVVGIVTEGVPRPSPTGWLIVAWLAAVNTAFAFTLWNHTLERLTAVESSVLNNTMLIQIAALAWIFLGESLDLRQLSGLAVALAGVLVVQLRRRRAAQVVVASAGQPSG